MGLILGIISLFPIEIWVALIVAVVGPMVLKILNYFLDNHKRKSFSQTADECVVVTNMLSEVKHRLRARRAFIMQYHNGGSFYSGNPRQKVSMTHETYDENRAHSILPQFQELPISYFSSMTFRLNKDGKIKQSSIKDIQDHTFRRILSEDEVTSHYAYAIYKKRLILKGWIPKYESVMVGSVHFYLDDLSQEMDITNLIMLESQVEQMKKYVI